MAYPRYVATGTPAFEGEVAKRRYPKALRPQLVVNRAGGWMRWENWLASTNLDDIAGMVFEDGHTVGDVSSDEDRELFRSAFLS